MKEFLRFMLFPLRAILEKLSDIINDLKILIELNKEYNAEQKIRFAKFEAVEIEKLVDLKTKMQNVAKSTAKTVKKASGTKTINPDQSDSIYQETKNEYLRGERMKPDFRKMEHVRNLIYKVYATDKNLKLKYQELSKEAKRAVIDKFMIYLDSEGKKPAQELLKARRYNLDFIVSFQGRI